MLNFKQGELQIDDFVAKFNTLVAKAGWELETNGTIQLFRDAMQPVIYL